jgi:hypothetical protein
MARGAYLYPDCKQDFYGDTWIRVVAHPHHVELAYLDKWTRTLTLTKGTHNLERELNGVMNTLLVPNTKREVLAHVIKPNDLKIWNGTQWREHISRPEHNAGGAIIPSKRTSKSGTQDHWDKMIKIQIQNVYWSRRCEFCLPIT